MKRLPLALASLVLATRAALAADPAELSVYLFDQHTPLADAEVRIDGAVRGRTSGDGALVLTLDAGKYVLTVVRDGVDVLRLEVELASDESAEMIATLYPDSAPSIFIESSHQDGNATSAQATQAAAGPPGTLAGRIVNSENGQPVPNARVFVAGTPLDVVTDAEGRYSAPITAGTYSISVIAPSFSSLTLEGIAIEAEKTTERAIELTPSGVELPEFVVLEPFVEGSLAAFVEERRASSAVTDILGAEQIARQGDSDAAGALRRVTGLTLVDGKYIYVRGLGERYSSVLLNGAQIPSPDPTRRVVPLDLFPTDVLQGVVIQKTYSAEMPGEFGGGTVQLRTKSFPESPFVKVGFSTGYVDGTTSSEGLTYDGGNRDWSGFDDGARALPESISAAISGGRYLREQNPANPDGFTPADFERFGEDLAAAGYAITRENVDPNLGLSASAGTSFALGSDSRWGFLTALRYNNAWDTSEELRRTYRATSSGDLRLADDEALVETTQNVDLSGFTTLGLEIGTEHRLGLTSMFLHQGEDETSLSEGVQDSQRLRQFELKWLESELFSNQLLGEHQLPLLNLGLDWQYTDARAARSEPNTRTYRRDDDDEDGSYSYSTRNSSNTQKFSKLVDNAANWDLALELPVALGQTSSIKFFGGVGRLTRDRTADIRRFGFRTRPGLPLSLFDLEQEELISPEYIRPNGLVLGETTSGSDNYTAEQSVDARFLSVDLSLLDRYRLVLGVREEQNLQSVVTRDISNPEQVILSEIDQADRLPTAAFTWWLSGDSQLRLGYGESLSRPDFRELSPSQFEDPLLDIVTVGNPRLKTTGIKNYDVRWEHYFSPTEGLSVAAFYKDFTNPIEKTFSSGGSAKIINLQNALAAEVYGIEFDFNKQLGFVGDWGPVARSFLGRVDWPDFYVSVNYAKIESSVQIDGSLTTQTNSDRPLQGQSPYVANAQLGYTDPENGSEWTLLYNVFGERIAQAGVQGQPDVYEQPLPQLDFVYRRRLGASWDLKLRLKNLLDPKAEYTQGPEVTRSTRKGREIGLTLEWSP